MLKKTKVHGLGIQMTYLCELLPKAQFVHCKIEVIASSLGMCGKA